MRRTLRGRPAALALSLVLSLVLALAASLSAAPVGAEPVPVPMSMPGGPAATEQLLTQAEAAGSHCVTVVRDGRTVLDRDLAPDVRTSPGWSITKSVTALLVGIAQDRGLLRVEHRVARYVPAWRGTPSRKVKIRHLLDNTSGRQWSEKMDYQRMAIGARDKTRFSIRRGQQHKPGKVWVYNNSAIQVLEAVLERATGMPVQRFARRHLFGPLKMRQTSINVDAAGNPMLFGGIATTCGDLARLGAMLVDRGRYQGRRVVSAKFWRQATQRSSQRHNAAYGLLFWVNRPGEVLGFRPGASRSGPLVPGAGDDALWALGLFEQYLFVSPSQRVVAVRLGAAPPPDTLSLTSFTELALAAR